MSQERKSDSYLSDGESQCASDSDNDMQQDEEGFEFTAPLCEYFNGGFNTAELSDSDTSSDSSESHSNDPSELASFMEESFSGDYELIDSDIENAVEIAMDNNRVRCTNDINCPCPACSDTVNENSSDSESSCTCRACERALRNE